MVKREFSDDWLPLGTHGYRFEEPDLFFIRDVGDVSVDDMALMYDRFEEAAARAGRPLFWLSDVSGIGHVSAEARKLPRDRDVAEQLMGTVVYGGSFHQRLVANMIMKAMTLLRPVQVRKPVLFCATEAEARAFVEQVRRGEGGG